MRRPDHLRAWCVFVGATLLLCVALSATGAGASVLSMQEARAATASTMEASSMPMMSDGKPCVLCYIAPTPSSHTFSGEGREPEPLT